MANKPMAMIAAMMTGFATAASAQAPLARSASPAAVPALVQTPAQALAQDAEGYARRYGVTPEQAVLRLRALHASAAVTDAIRQRYRERLVAVRLVRMACVSPVMPGLVRQA